MTDTTPAAPVAAPTKVDRHGFKRGPGGAFAKGTKGGPGRLSRVRDDQYLTATFETVSIDDWRTIIRRAVKDAKAGSWRAREFLAKHLLPRPNSQVTIAPTLALGLNVPMPPADQIEQALLSRIQHLIEQHATGRIIDIDGEPLATEPPEQTRKDSTWPT